MTREEAALKLSFHMMQCGMLMPLGWIDKNGEGSELFEAFKMAQDALRERDALMAEIKDMCFMCRHYNDGDGNEECVNCHDEDNFEWRGAQANVPDKNVVKCTACDGGFGDNTMEFAEHGYKFCPYCGRRLEDA